MTARVAKGTETELKLLERLVWVPYKDHWWPALLYADYSELQSHLYDELDTVLKAQFAVAIMRHMNESKKIKVARLLGREILEVVEVDDKQYAEFYWQLPKVLPMACRKSRYGDDTQLYLDFHRALDQVEEIIREISENSFSLMISKNGEEKKTWLQRAKETLNKDDCGLLYLGKSKYHEMLSREDMVLAKAAVDQEESNFLFKALDDMMGKLNDTIDSVSCDGRANNIDDRTAFSCTGSNKKTPMDIHSETLSKQKKYRKALREVMSKQQEKTAGLEEFQKRSFSEQRECVSTSVPELSVSVSKMKADVSTGQMKKPIKTTVTIETRGDDNPADDDREAMKAAARAAAAQELNESFWDMLTCHTAETRI